MNHLTGQQTSGDQNAGPMQESAEQQNSEKQNAEQNADQNAEQNAEQQASGEPVLSDLELPSRRLIGSTTGVQILSVGAFAPDNEVSNEDLAELGFDDQWIVRRTGIRSRRMAAAELASSDIGLAAARDCLARCQDNTSSQDVDLILVATMTPDQPIPSTACVVQKGLQSSAAAFDLNAACAGFMYALVTGMQFVKSGVYQRVLVVGVDLMSRTVDPKMAKTYPLFGDGAGAVLLGPGEPQQGFTAFTLGADGRGGPLLMTPAGGSREPITNQTLAERRQYMQMDGRAVFKWAVRAVGETSRDVLRAASLQAEDVDWFIMHQANKRILDAAAEKLGIPSERVLMNLDRYGNTSAASIPLVLDEAARSGKLQPGNKVLLNAFGAGLSWGAGLFHW